MKRCPDCGFRTEERICPLCGVRTRPCEVPVHVHTPDAPCMLPNREQPAPQPARPQMNRQAAQKARANGAHGQKVVMLIVKILVAIFLLNLAGQILSVFF